MQITATENRYFINPGYESRDQALTRVTEAGENWKDWRIRDAGDFQYYVYDVARQFLKIHSFESVLDLGSGPPIKARDLLRPVCEDVTLGDQPTIRNLATDILPDAPFFEVDLESGDTKIDRKFDLIVCADVIEYLEKPELCLEFIRDQLTPQGIARISTPE